MVHIPNYMTKYKYAFVISNYGVASLPSKRKAKKSNSLNDIADLTRISVASTVGVVTMNSLPATPNVPAMEGAKSFAGSAFGMVQTIGAGNAVLGSLESLQSLDRRSKKKRK